MGLTGRMHLMSPYTFSESAGTLDSEAARNTVHNVNGEGAGYWKVYKPLEPATLSPSGGLESQSPKGFTSPRKRL
jgi:hypothetical protein